MRKRNSVLGIDWGSRYIGVAYCQEGNTVIFPIGYLLNDQMIVFNLADILQKYGVKTIVIGRPSKQKDIQEKIDKFIKSLSFVMGDDIKLEKMEEDYSSVQAGEIVSDTFKNIEGFKKNPLEDTISAMIILDRWLHLNPQKI